MLNRIDSGIFGFSNRVVINADKDTYKIIKKRKSRIIMKDGLQILSMAKKIKEDIPTAKIQLHISGPICSKTLKFLNENSIAIVHEKA